MADIASKHGLRTEVYCKNQYNKTKLAQHKLFILHKGLFKVVHKYVTGWSALVIKVGVPCVYQGF